MHDALTLEHGNIPTVCICSKPFINTAKAVAQIKGVPQYPFAIVTHPVGSVDANTLSNRTAEALPQVLHIFTGQ